MKISRRHYRKFYVCDSDIPNHSAHYNTFMAKHAMFNYK